jgi:uncharacterized protein YggE
VSGHIRVGVVVLAFLCVAARPASAQQQVGTKFVQDTIVVEAEGRFEADPDLATLTFDVTSQDKDMKKAYGGADRYAFVRPRPE